MRHKPTVVYSMPLLL